MGEWLEVNERAIYGSKMRKGEQQQDPLNKDIWYTQNGDDESIIYAFSLR